MLIPNRMFRNAEGRFFQDVTTSSGTGHLQKGHGVAFGDIDNDGDQDIYITMGGAYTGDFLLELALSEPWSWQQLVDTQAGRSEGEPRRHRRAATVTAITPKGDRDIYAVVSSGGSFGGSSLQQEIGLGDAHAIRQLKSYGQVPDTGRLCETSASIGLQSSREAPTIW